MSSSPIAIRYYQCINSGIGIIIYPQLRAANNPENIIWDGREVPGFEYMLDVGKAVAVDLTTTSISQDTPFFLSEDTVFGVDQYETSQAFIFDPKSDLMATGERYGAVDGGELVYQGTRPYQTVEIEEARVAAKSAASQPHATVLAAIIHEAITKANSDSAKAQSVNNPLRYLGKIRWPGAIAAVAMAYTVQQLPQHRLRVDNHISIQGPDHKWETEFTLEPEYSSSQNDPEAAAVPPKIQEAWDGAIRQVTNKYGVENLGIEPMPQ